MCAVLCLSLSASLLSCGRKEPEARFDLIVRNGNVVDGSGQLWFPGDVAVKGDEIVKVGRLEEDEMTAKRIIDARGLTVAPGFIDIHSHSD